ncbi:hypothetical protein NP511_17130 [Natrinema thermotolerans]|uniref:Uncharacterized protein n=1 Tax=Natrinema thermotolerans TaxID=121872 RepID=A0AAF0T1D6_9EURY|nr:hypothetical protein [Natrinema thermotolerans]ELZ10220.1 hypothetical protein C478_15047 [Natrinema thermotolerans DSM 11552]QCC60090.1 hypothetical protein DVR14_16225 [Natrinema thermotolerans]QCC61005.1 hypothetical protein DVR14_20345 [Natrinema thermotolerans]WMT07097.1 hypothetical protein NP511_17130 [Natrinema thermotolerans]
MRLELRVCQHCLDGDHGNEKRTALLNDMVNCAEQIKKHKEVIDLDEVHIRRVKDDEPGKPAALPVVSATIQNDQVVLNDTQLVAEGQDGNMLLYANPDDVLTVLAGNLDEISKAVTEDVTVDLSPIGAEIVSEADLGANREQEQ